MTPTVIGIFGVLALVVLLVCSLPVAVAMALVGVAGYALVISGRAALAMLSADLYDVFANYNLASSALCFHGELHFTG